MASFFRTLTTTFTTTTAADAGALSQMVGTNSGSLPPAYLSIPNFKDCFGTQSVGTSSIVCIPEIMPTACTAKSWGQLQADNAGLKACDTATATTELPTDAEIKQYEAKLQNYMQAHSDEIKKFVAEHKEAIDGVDVDIEKAIESGKFDIENYQTEIKKIVDTHGLKQYRLKFDAFVASHKAELEAFQAAHKGEIGAVQDKIEASIKSGSFNIENYQQQIEGFVKQHGLEQYEKKLEAFFASHKTELEAFKAAHKAEIDAVQDKIQAGIKSGNFDIENYRQQIQKYQADNELNDEKSTDKDDEDKDGEKDKDDEDKDDKDKDDKDKDDKDKDSEDKDDKDAATAKPEEIKKATTTRRLRGHCDILGGCK